MRIARDVLDQPAFKELDGGETWPGPGVETDEEILDWIARTAQSNMHPTSTCRLGTDGESVVDPLTMGVHGIEGLAVADASVMPLCPNSATHAPTMMLAEKAADLILGNAPLPPRSPARVAEESVARSRRTPELDQRKDGRERKRAPGHSFPLTTRPLR